MLMRLVVKLLVVVSKIGAESKLSMAVVFITFYLRVRSENSVNASSG